jgi:VWFA-related protein
MSTKIAWFWYFVLLTFVLATVAGLAQENANPVRNQQTSGSQNSNQFLFRRNVNRVVVDVVVSDSNGKPVRGLAKQDFAIYEDGKPQTILSFEAHSLDSSPGYYKKLPPMPPNEFVNIATEPEKGPLYVLLVDLLNTERDDQPYARQQLLKFIANKPEGTRFAVFVLSDGLHLVQGFTSNRGELNAALDPSSPRPHIPRIFLLAQNYGKGDSVWMVNVFKRIALFLDGLPGRKNIIWLSDAFPLDLFPHRDDAPDMRADVTETLDALARSESVIYTVDLSGVDPFPAGRSTGSTLSAAPASGAPGIVVSDSNTLSQQMQIVSSGNASESGNISNAVQDTIAGLTGGRAFYSRNDLKNAIEEATEAGADYYTLTYSPSNQTFDGKLRKIRVQLATKGYHLEYRRGYLGTAPESPIMPIYYDHKQEQVTEGLKLRPIGDSLSAYMQHGAPIAREVYFRAYVHALAPPAPATREQMANLVDQPTYFRARQKKHPSKPLAPVKLQTCVIDYQIIARVPSFEVAAGVYDEDGNLLNGDVEEASPAQTVLSDPNAKFAYFRVQQKIDIPISATSIRLAVRDVSTDRMGTLEIPFPLAPEPTQTPVSVSSPSSSLAKP